MKPTIDLYIVSMKRYSRNTHAAFVFRSIFVVIPEVVSILSLAVVIVLLAVALIVVAIDVADIPARINIYQ